MKTSLLVGIIIIVLVLVGAGIYFLTIGSYNNPPNANPQTNPPNANLVSPDTTPSTNSIEISGFAFNPSALTIKKGDRAVWTNKDPAPHTVISDSGNEISSNSLSKEETYSHTFASAGTFAYHCSIHPSMKATIIVV